jgi:hypothetical protein
VVGIGVGVREERWPAEDLRVERHREVRLCLVVGIGLVVRAVRA